MWEGRGSGPGHCQGGVRPAGAALRAVLVRALLQRPHLVLRHRLLRLVQYAYLTALSEAGAVANPLPASGRSNLMVRNSAGQYAAYADPRSGALTYEEAMARPEGSRPLFASVPYAQRQPGDLIFFSQGGPGGMVSHVAMYAGVENGVEMTYESILSLAPNSDGSRSSGPRYSNILDIDYVS